MLDFLNEAEQQKQELASIGVTEADIAPEPAAPLSLLEPPQHWTEKAREEDGDMKFFGKMLLGGFTGMTPFLFPEMIGSKERYRSDLGVYQEQQKAQLMGEMVNGIDFDNLTAGDVALLDQIGMGDQAADMFTAQTAGIGGDQSIADAFGYTPYQWSQLSPEKRRDLTDRHTYEKGGEGAFDYRLSADGKSPEQLQQAKESELYGSGLGQQLADDRQIITGAQSQVEMLDASAAKIKGIREILEDNPDATGWNRIFRDVFNINTEADGVLSEAEANGVVEQIKQATFGAISQAELDLLRQALMDPSKSTEFNIGTLSAALKTVQDKRKQTISSGRQAVDRYSASDTQNDFESLMKSDWAYNNIGAGSRVPSIPAFGGASEYTFQQYVKETVGSLGPFDPQPSRDELLIGFSEKRDQAEAEYNAMIEKQKADAEAAKRARLGLDRPWPTVKQ